LCRRPRYQVKTLNDQIHIRMRSQIVQRKALQLVGISPRAEILRLAFIARLSQLAA
jgi:hypothetical protein